MPVQAKVDGDQTGIVQTQRESIFLRGGFPRYAAAQSLAVDVIALFELVLQDDQLGARQKRHYRWVKTEIYAPPKR